MTNDFLQINKISYVKLVNNIVNEIFCIFIFELSRLFAKNIQVFDGDMNFKFCKNIRKQSHILGFLILSFEDFRETFPDFGNFFLLL